MRGNNLFVLVPGASSVLADSDCNIEYNDLDLIFAVDLTSQKQYDQVKQVVLDSLIDLLPEGTSKKRMSSSTLKGSQSLQSRPIKFLPAERGGFSGILFI